MSPFNTPPPGHSYPLEFAGHGQNALEVVRERFLERVAIMVLEALRQIN
jgi:hypothetical protein